MTRLRLGGGRRFEDALRLQQLPQSGNLREVLLEAPVHDHFDALKPALAEERGHDHGHRPEDRARGGEYGGDAHTARIA